MAADKEQLRILKKDGVGAWNEWRRQHHAGPDLHEANLSKANLSGADLSGANLYGANLYGANLRGADLSRAILDGATLYGANLMGANLTMATLIQADLSWANLRRANLRGANLSGADFLGANLRKASLFETVLGNVDLSGCENLETIRHDGPSVVDIRTLQQSGPLPLVFLRGVGLPDKLIDYLPSLLASAIEFYSCFISYSSKNEDFARRLHADLQNKGVRCWLAPKDMKIGAKIRDNIGEAIRLRDKVLLVLSEDSIASDWVEDEVDKAFEEEIQRGGVVLFPVRIDDTVLTTNEAWASKLRRSRNIADFRAWKHHDAYQTALKGVLRYLQDDDFLDDPAELSEAVGDYDLHGLSEADDDYDLAVVGALKDDATVMQGNNILIGFTAEQVGLLIEATPSRSPLPPEAEPVDAAVFCPPRVMPNTVFLLQVWLYPPPAEAVVRADAQQRDPTSAKLGSYSLPIDVSRGTRIDVRLEMPTLVVEEADAVVVWRGVPTAMQFEVTVPNVVEPANAIGRVRFAIAGVPAGTLRFQVNVTTHGNASQPAELREAQAARYRRAFASYASQDRAEVLRRVQAFKIAGLSVFQDILDLGPGERWEKALYREIDRSDVFLLFWSKAAAASEWVSKEIDYALARQGDDAENPPAIQPVPIEGPPIAPPPPRLAGLHFNDALLAHISRAVEDGRLPSQRPDP